jgi:hypothetical protein
VALPGELAAKDFNDDTPYTPAWQERITGTPREQLITVARQFADNADKTHGKSMVIIGAAMNHWYHADMNYRGCHQHVDDVRLHRPKRRWLGALCGSRKIAPTNRLDGAGVCTGLDSPAPANEQHQLFLCPHRPMAL